MRASAENTVGRPNKRTAKSSRPQKGAGRASERPKRNARSIAEFRDILGVLNKDPDKRYRWIKSAANFDKRIFDARRAGWDFVDATKEKDLIIGEYAVAKSNETDGSLYRVPAGHRSDDYLYLMWMPEEYAQEVDAWKAQKTDLAEADLFRERRLGEDEETGQYATEDDLEIWEEERHAPAAD